MLLYGYLIYALWVCAILAIIATCVTIVSYVADQFSEHGLSKKVVIGNDAESRQLLKTVAIMIALLLTSFLNQYLFNSILKGQIRSYTKDYNPKTHKVLINDMLIYDATEIAKELNYDGSVPANKSSPTRKIIHIQIVKEIDTITVDLHRDSRNKGIYWVYYNPYQTLDESELFKISTAALDNY